MHPSVFAFIFGAAVISLATQASSRGATWPKGTYGLPMPKSGCPRRTKFPWHRGTRYHDTEDSNPNNVWSRHWDLAGRIGKNNMEQEFCMKTSSVGVRHWPKGEYCIFKRGTCPMGFSTGWIRWDDEDSRNANTRSGAMPDGRYDQNTIIWFCCRIDGFATNAIILPTNSPFVLFKKGFQCQYVKNMYTREEFFRWDTEDDKTNNRFGGSIPAGGVNKNIILKYCYYY